jgi:hypothetical protein
MLLLLEMSWPFDQTQHIIGKIHSTGALTPSYERRCEANVCCAYAAPGACRAR